jgi:osmotically-inducible protein OsmY
MAPAPSAADNDTRAPLVADSQASNATNPAEPPRAPAGAPETAEPAHPAADDTKVNERDTKSGALTPMDQNNNANDLKITQRIRQAVMADDSLSFTAKNVKIITQNGKVTLRGPVNSAQERSAIDAAARKVAGAAQVDNQLEVKK